MRFLASEQRIYPGKLLLFGEHLLLTGASALAVPVPAFYGQWKWADTPETGREQQRRLVDFAAYLAEEGLIGPAFSEDLATGLYFESNIPEGYGLGSSGALCAAIFDRYGILPDAAAVRDQPQPDWATLKKVFARMESFFHGNSSGIDPLTSYANQPLLIENKTQVRIPKIATWENPPVVFLADSQLPRQTGPLVQWYLQQYELPDFRHRLEQEMLPAHEQMLQAWCHADASAFWPALRAVSRFQFEHFPPMIPTTLRHFWQESLLQSDFTLKICGAGGGGFVLGFARNNDVVEHYSGQFNINIKVI